MGFEEYGTNAAEGSLCKTLEDWVRKIFDHVFPRQMQFSHGPSGKNLLKHYDSNDWEEL
jgi:hypothetical protein